MAKDSCTERERERERERDIERERGFFFDTKAGRGCEGVEMKEAGTGGTE
jgi:hypothetical protein